MILDNKKLGQIKDSDIINNTFNSWQTIEHLAVNCFSHNLKLQEITIPHTIKKIESGCFMKCSNLKKVVWPNTVSCVPASCFLGCTKLEEVYLPDNITSFGPQAFEGCYRLKNIDWPKNLTEIGFRGFENCISLKEVILPESIDSIASRAFFGCEALKLISVPKSSGGLGNLLEGTNFKYYYEKESENRNFFATELPTDLTGISNILDISVCQEMYYDFNSYISYFVKNEDRHQIIKMAEILKKKDIKLPYSMIEELSDRGEFEKFVKNSHFTFFKKEAAFILDEAFQTLESYYKNNFFKFAMYLGCFNTDKMLDKTGKETNTFVYQKASTLLVLMYKKGMFKDMSILTDINKRKISINQDFLNFLLFKEGKDSYINLEFMKELENFAPGSFLRVMENFDKVKEYKVYINEKGLPKNRTWKAAIQKFLTQKAYKNVQQKDKSLAELFSVINMGQLDFEQAVKIRDDAKKSGVKAHILNKELKEDTIVESIQKIKHSAQALSIESKQLIDELYAKQFTYEMLDKFDDRNFVLGAYTNCCANINSIFYGSEITHFSVAHNGLQTMIIKNYKGDIVAKGTIYVNEQQGYAVINDFEINYKYKENEKFGIPGYYKDNKESAQRHERDLIFNAFMRGIKAFVTEYDKQHPNNPLTQINVGRGNNKLQEQLDDFENATDILDVPDNYKFMDAKESQVILYKRKNYIEKTY